MMNESSNRRCLAALAALLALSATASPQPIADINSASEPHWAEGISPGAQEAARRVFLEGNHLLKQAFFLPAIEKYRAALKSWDHPGVHYNLALALASVDPLEGYKHMKEAIRYGSKPLDDHKLEYARTYMTLIEKQSARVKITCEEPGASVTLDGKPLFVAPGRFDGLVHPGTHNVVAAKAGFHTREKSLNLPPGGNETIPLKLYRPPDLETTLWPMWVPWTVMGTGAALALSSSVVHFQARDAYRAFDAGIIACGGCVPEPNVARWRSRGDLLQGTAYGGYALGGAALITGAVMLYLNISQTYRMTEDEIEGRGGAPAKPRASVAPWLGPRSGGTTLTFRF